MPDSEVSRLLCIGASIEEDVAADRAELKVTVEGSSLFTGRAALSKSREVSALVQELVRAGIPESAVSLESVSANVSSGLLGKSSSARYDLRIAIADLERLADALGAVTGAKQAALSEILWRYPDDVAAHVAWLERSIGHANQKAQAAAKALGVRIVGVHRLREAKVGEPMAFAAQSYGGAPGGYDGMKRRAGGDMSGIPLSHKKRDGVRIEVEYVVEGFTPPT